MAASPKSLVTKWLARRSSQPSSTPLVEPVREPKPEPDPPSALDPEDRRKHLDLVQGAVNRMAGASANAKSWLLPVVTAAFGFCAVEGELSIGLLGLGAVVLFAFIDAQYLRQERAFRALYRDAVSAKVPLYEMSPARYYSKPNGDEDDDRAENCRWKTVIWSWSLAGFYLPMFLVGVAIAATTVPWNDLRTMIC